MCILRILVSFYLRMSREKAAIQDVLSLCKKYPATKKNAVDLKELLVIQQDDYGRIPTDLASQQKIISLLRPLQQVAKDLFGKEQLKDALEIYTRIRDFLVFQIPVVHKKVKDEFYLFFFQMQQNIGICNKKLKNVDIALHDFTFAMQLAKKSNSSSFTKVYLYAMDILEDKRLIRFALAVCMRGLEQLPADKEFQSRKSSLMAKLNDKSMSKESKEIADAGSKIELFDQEFATKLQAIATIQKPKYHEVMECYNALMTNVREQQLRLLQWGEVKCLQRVLHQIITGQKTATPPPLWPSICPLEKILVDALVAKDSENGPEFLTLIRRSLSHLDDYFDVYDFDDSDSDVGSSSDEETLSDFLDECTTEYYLYDVIVHNSILWGMLETTMRSKGDTITAITLKQPSANACRCLKDMFRLFFKLVTFKNEDLTERAVWYLRSKCLLKTDEAKVLIRALKDHDHDDCAKAFQTMVKKLPEWHSQVQLTTPVTFQWVDYCLYSALMFPCMATDTGRCLSSREDLAVLLAFQSRAFKAMGFAKAGDRLHLMRQLFIQISSVEELARRVEVSGVSSKCEEFMETFGRLNKSIFAEPMKEEVAPPAAKKNVSETAVPAPQPVQPVSQPAAPPLSKTAKKKLKKAAAAAAAAATAAATAEAEKPDARGDHPVSVSVVPNIPTSNPYALLAEEHSTLEPVPPKKPVAPPVVLKSTVEVAAPSKPIVPPAASTNSGMKLVTPTKSGGPLVARNDNVEQPPATVPVATSVVQKPTKPAAPPVAPSAPVTGKETKKPSQTELLTNQLQQALNITPKVSNEKPVASANTMIPGPVSRAELRSTVETYIRNHEVQLMSEVLRRFSSTLHLSYSLQLVCSRCFNRSTYNPNLGQHRCARDILLAKNLVDGQWGRIRVLEDNGYVGQYYPCRFTPECKRLDVCPFAHNVFEITFWNEVNVNSLMAELRSAVVPLLRYEEDLAQERIPVIPGVTDVLAAPPVEPLPMAPPPKPSASVLSRNGSISGQSGTPDKRTKTGSSSSSSLASFVNPLLSVDILPPTTGRGVPADMPPESTAQIMLTDPILPDKLPLLDYEFCLRCPYCVEDMTHKIGVTRIYLYAPNQHSCLNSLLLVRNRENADVNSWLWIRPRVCKNVYGDYAMCRYFGQRCVKGLTCTYAHSEEEYVMWMLDYKNLFSIITFLYNQQPMLETVEKCVQRYALSYINVVFLMLCERCFHNAPRRISFRQSNGKCDANLHNWNPVLFALEDNRRSLGEEVQNEEKWRKLYEGGMGRPCTELHIVYLRESHQRTLEFCKYFPKCTRSQDCNRAHSDVEFHLWQFEVTMKKRFRSIPANWRDLLQLDHSRRDFILRHQCIMFSPTDMEQMLQVPPPQLYSPLPLPGANTTQPPPSRGRTRTSSSHSNQSNGATKNVMNVWHAAGMDSGPTAPITTVASEVTFKAPFMTKPVPNPTSSAVGGGKSKKSSKPLFPFPLSQFCKACYSRYRGLLTPRMPGKDVCMHADRHPWTGTPTFVDRDKREVRNPLEHRPKYSMCRNQERCSFGMECHSAHSNNECLIWNWMGKHKKFDLLAICREYDVHPAITTEVPTPAPLMEVEVRSKPVQGNLFPLPLLNSWSQVAQLPNYMKPQSTTSTMESLSSRIFSPQSSISSTPSLTGRGGGAKHGPTKETWIFCGPCAASVSSHQDWDKHRRTPRHVQRLIIDVSSQWKFRPPPAVISREICPGAPDGESASCAEELHEWMERNTAYATVEELAKRQPDLWQRMHDLLQRLLTHGFPSPMLPDNLGNVCFFGPDETSVVLNQLPGTHSWDFTLTGDPMVQCIWRVILVLPSSSSYFTATPITNLRSVPNVPSNVSITIPMLEGMVSFRVNFNCSIEGYYEQWLFVSDESGQHSTLRRLAVIINDNSEGMATVLRVREHSQEWHRLKLSWQNVESFDDANTHLSLATAAPVFPYTNPNKNTFANFDDTLLTPTLYMGKMHQLLYLEEIFQCRCLSNLCDAMSARVREKGAQLLPKLIVPGEMWLNPPQPGQLFLAINLPDGVDLLQENRDPRVYLIRRSVQMAFIEFQVTMGNRNIQWRVECPLVGANSHYVPEDTLMVSPHCLYFLLSAETVGRLHLASNCFTEETQCSNVLRVILRPGYGKQNISPFIGQHIAISKQQMLANGRPVAYPDTNLNVVLRSMSEVRPVMTSELNSDQQFIVEELARDYSHIYKVGLSPPPYLLCGSFGSGKTCVIGHIIRYCLNMPNTPRILVCTHANSAANVYITRELHGRTTPDQQPDPRVVRLFPADRRLNMVGKANQVLAKYCLIENQTRYRKPTMAELRNRQYKVVVTTLNTLSDILTLSDDGGERLPYDAEPLFNYILVDEAAQVLETEALIPLSLATAHTRIMFAGDALQQKPLILSPASRRAGLNLTIVDRLWRHYETVGCFQRTLLKTVYRSNALHVRFLSDAFYGGVLVCDPKVDLEHRPPRGVASMAMNHVYFGGGETLDRVHGMRNVAEARAVVRRVEELLTSESAHWGLVEEDICVVSIFPGQVQLIRTLLRYLRIRNVQVSSLYDVQGCEYRVVLISTVLTRQSNSSEMVTNDEDEVEEGANWHGMDFLNEPSLINSAMTRALSVMEVFGDVDGLCNAGHPTCQIIWRKFLNFCTTYAADSSTAYRQAVFDQDKVVGFAPVTSSV